MASAISSRRALLDGATRSRVADAKRLLVVCGVAVFGAAFVATKASHPSHAKHGLTRLDAPSGFVRQLQDDSLRGGVVAAPQAPPQAETAVS
jgi:hypothetical protein